MSLVAIPLAGKLLGLVAGHAAYDAAKSVVRPTGPLYDGIAKNVVSRATGQIVGVTPGATPIVPVFVYEDGFPAPGATGMGDCDGGDWAPPTGHWTRASACPHDPPCDRNQIGSQCVLDWVRRQEALYEQGPVDPPCRPAPTPAQLDAAGVRDGFYPDGHFVCGTGWCESGASSLGDLSTWAYPMFHTLDSSEVYVVRLRVTGAPLADGKDLLLFVKALGVAQTLGFDIRGVAAWQSPGDDTSTWWVDIVCTVTGWEGPPSPGHDAAALAYRVGQEPQLLAAFPSLHVDPALSLWGELTGPAGAIDFWKSQPMLWDHTLPGPKCVALYGGCGGPTNTWASPPAASIVHGKADDGAMAMPWSVTGPVPIVSGTDTSKDYALGGRGVTYLAVAGVLAFGAYYYFSKSHGRARR